MLREIDNGGVIRFVWHSGAAAARGAASPAWYALTRAAAPLSRIFADCAR